MSFDSASFFSSDSAFEIAFARDSCFATSESVSFDSSLSRRSIECAFSSRSFSCWIVTSFFSFNFDLAALTSPCSF
jgi:hypothetical protein